MGKITLYGIDRSPPFRAVKLTLAALELPYELVSVNVVAKEHLSEAYVKKNPQHTIPMLEDGDATIWDSHAIITYLVSKYGKDDSLYPKDLLKRAVVDQRLHFESGVVFANSLRAITKSVFFLAQKVIPKDKIQTVVEVYDFVESFLKGHDYIAGDKLTVADFSLISSVSSLTAYLEIDSAKYPNTTAWIKRLEQLPYYSANDVGKKQFIEAIKATKFTIEQ
ncbi:glutathione S-transferase 1-like [Drosophila sulfurigaster albostrigata]|uniref:glutathione S-transferase 1-like n=1 Tax=Drosophila sulfurigaster albostrigata TaxID=89887 RepID=UPI002D21B28C|nr:glutathione S-transferase 1-like [Drosophila sulfurigaster albostrigata]